MIQSSLAKAPFKPFSNGQPSFVQQISEPQSTVPVPMGPVQGNGGVQTMLTDQGRQLQQVVMYQQAVPR